MQWQGIRHSHWQELMGFLLIFFHTLRMRSELLSDRERNLLHSMSFLVLSAGTPVHLGLQKLQYLRPPPALAVVRRKDTEFHKDWSWLNKRQT